MCKPINYQDLVQEILIRAFRGQPVPEGDHPFDNEEIQACFEHDLCSLDERRKIIDHLSICPACRRRIHLLGHIETSGASK